MSAAEAWGAEALKLIALADEVCETEGEKAAMMNGFSLGWTASIESRVRLYESRLPEPVPMRAQDAAECANPDCSNQFHEGACCLETTEWTHDA